VYRTLTVNYPTETRDIMTSTGAGLGIILQYLGTSLFPLLIVFMIVGIIVVIGYSIVSAVKGNFSLRNR
jgi:hypothetical protein